MLAAGAVGVVGAGLDVDAFVNAGPGGGTGQSAGSVALGGRTAHRFSRKGEEASSERRELGSRSGGALAVLMRWRRILPTSGASLMTAMSFISDPQ
jgi:hypothetical protein